MTDLPLDINGNRCELGRLYWINSPNNPTYHQLGRFHRTFRGPIQITTCWPGTGYIMITSFGFYDFAPADPPEFPPRESTDE